MHEFLDPFRRQPELRGKIRDPLTSAFRSFSVATLEAKAAELGLPTGWWYSDAEREASRAEALAGREGADLWLFAYGSLMWDPALRFAEVRRAHVPGYARRFILKDIYGPRGNAGQPGLMAALDHGPGCDGLLFRIARDDVPEETAILWRREKIGPAYIPAFVEAVADTDRVEALTFIADHEAELIDAGITRAEQIRFLATGTGFLGSSLDYLRNIADHFETLGIEDREVTDLLAETLAFMRSR